MAKLLAKLSPALFTRLNAHGLTSLRLVLAVLGATLALASIVAVVVIAWVVRLDQQIAARLAQRRFAPPVEFYSAPEILRPGQKISGNFLRDYFVGHGYRQRQPEQLLGPGDFTEWAADVCREKLRSEVDPGLIHCFSFVRKHEGGGQPSTVVLGQIEAQPTEQAIEAVLETRSGLTAEKVPELELDSELFAQFYGSEPILRREVSLGQTPTDCLNAILAIEDAHYLEHRGVSWLGVLRALWTNLQSGRIAQGGSTLTQQLVKNYFLTSEKTLRRKAMEFAMALLLEARASKDEILETYINVIYMGQSGALQIRGLAAASDYYFNQPLESLNLPQCSLLAALINSPGLFNPFTHPERARARRLRVLERMQSLKLIDDKQLAWAKAADLPSTPSRQASESAPYFVDAVEKNLSRLGIDRSEGLRVDTTLNLRAQKAAEQSIAQTLEQIATRTPRLRQLKSSGRALEVVLLAADNETGQVQALIGGRKFSKTQFNRAVDSRRQVGSVMKPFVYAAAFSERAGDAQWTPLSLIPDERFTHHYPGGRWSPDNYDGKFRGQVPVFYALAESLNSATARLGLDVGLQKVLDTARQAGMAEARLEPLPSLTLGAFEVPPLEVLQAYTTLARMGSYKPISLWRRITDLQGRVIREQSTGAEQRLDPAVAAIVVGMLKQTLVFGTARSISQGGFTRPAAGKTGTTSDTKDAWFVGFTPQHTALVWVGFDDNSVDGLTGATGAVPLWSAYMKNLSHPSPPSDFNWPLSVSLRKVSREELAALGLELPVSELELVFAAPAPSN